MTRSAAIDQLARQPNGSYVGVWGKYLLHSAFQPIFAFGDSQMEIAAFEGLIRPFENGNPVSPGEFFGSVGAADRFAVETLTRNLHILNSSSCQIGTAKLFLNFDPSVFVDSAISDAALRDMKLSLSHSSVGASQIVCELTEHKSGSEAAFFSFVRALKLNGFSIALDDYGADESDYGRVKALEPDIIKFDGGWISRLMETQAGAGLLKAMVSTFKDMGIQTLFEGLEEIWQLDLAHKCGVDLVQGFVLAVPKIVGDSTSIDETPHVSAEPVVDQNVDGDAAEQPPSAIVPHRTVRTFGKRGAT